MGRRPESCTTLSDTLSICEFKTGGREHEGFWLYDKTRGMNLAMRAKTERDAFVKALEYYQERTAHVERQYKELQAKVDTFVSQFVPDEDNEYNY